MKTRENELHEPLIGTSPQIGKCIAAVKCSVCDYTLLFTQGKDVEDAAARARAEIPNYCPNCGARLKEVKNENF